MKWAIYHLFYCYINYCIICNKKAKKKAELNHGNIRWGLFQSEVVKVATKVSIPTLPIMAAKATMFLDYTSTHPKVLLSFLNVPQFHFAYM